MRLYGPHADTGPRTVLVMVAGYGERAEPEHPDITRQRRQMNEHARWTAACAHVAAGGAVLTR